jgi:flagellar hook-length control protein FliK
MGGFLAILASLETSQAADPTTTMVDGVLPGNMGIATAFEAPASLRNGIEKAFEQRGGISIRIGNDANSIAVPDPEDPLETDIGRPLQGGLADPGAAAMLAAQDPQPQTELPQGTSSLLAQSSSLPTLATAGTEPGSAGPAAGGVAGVRLPYPAVKSDGAAVLNDLAAGFASEPTGKVGKSQKDATARLALVSATLSAPSESTGHSETRNIFAAAKLTEVPLTPIATALAIANTATPARREDQAWERSIFRPSLNEGTAIVPSYLPTASNAVTPGVSESPTPAAMYVAEKVAYWISNDVQSAEMKLDGIGSDPVEVSIRMQGNEAHIAFRTD